MTKLMTLESGKMAVQAPYNGDFVADLKANVPSAKWNGRERLWVFAPISKPQVEKLLAEYFPAKAALQLVRITWENLSRAELTIDNTHLASVQRDWWKWRGDCPIDFRVIDANLESGGSRKYPGLYGDCTIEAHIREGANINPYPAKVEVLEQGEQYGPLSNFTDEELAEEMIKRNYEVVRRIA
jgi:hypothetical protein